MNPSTDPATGPATTLSPIEIARETLSKLASGRLAPTPENFRQIYNSIADQSGKTTDEPLDRKLAEFIKSLPEASSGLTTRRALEQALARRDWNSARAAILALATSKGGNADAPATQPSARLLKELINGLDTGNAGWTRAKKRQSLDALLAGTADSTGLLTRLEGLNADWMRSGPSKSLQLADVPNQATVSSTAVSSTAVSNAPTDAIGSLGECLVTTLETALPGLLRHAPELALEARALAARARQASTPLLLGQLSGDLRDFTQRIELQAGGDGRMREALLGLLRLLIDNFEQLVEGDHWIRDQVAIVRAVLDRPLTLEVINQAEQAIKELMLKQGALKRSVEEAKASLKALLQNFIERLAETSIHTDEYQQKLEAHSETLQNTHDIASINAVIRDLIRDTTAMKEVTENSRVALTTAREHVRAADLRIQQMESELKNLSATAREDKLTGTLNRHGLEEAFKREAARADRQGSPMCTALIDIDNFKDLNDALGHQAGDEALVHIVRVIRDHLRPADVLARYGGEEFLILLPDSDVSSAIDVMTRLQRELTKRFFLHGNKKLLITFSCGVSERAAGEELEPAVSRADRALYQAKGSGKNRVSKAEA